MATRATHRKTSGFSPRQQDNNGERVLASLASRPIVERVTGASETMKSVCYGKHIAKQFCQLPEKLLRDERAVHFILVRMLSFRNDRDFAGLLLFAAAFRADTATCPLFPTGSRPRIAGEVFRESAAAVARGNCIPGSRLPLQARAAPPSLLLRPPVASPLAPVLTSRSRTSLSPQLLSAPLYAARCAPADTRRWSCCRKTSKTRLKRPSG